MAVFVICLSLWLTNLIPLASTGLLAVALLPLLGIVEPKQAFAYFGNSAVFFILGVFLLSAAMIRTGLSKRLTLILLQRFDRRPGLLIVGVTCSASFLSLWMPEHAVAAMMFPIILEIADSLGLKKGRSAYARSLFFGLAWGAAIGGCGTFLGGARAPLAVALLQDTFRDAGGDPMYAVSFLGWMKVSMPLVIVMTAAGAFILLKLAASDVTDIAPATRMLNERVRTLGPLSVKERRLAVTALITIACWIILGHKVDIAVIAVLSAVSLSALGIVTWQDTQEYVNWGVVVMYGGAVAIGAALKDTHAMYWLIEQVLPTAGISPVWLLILMAGLAMVLSAGISNAAAVAVLLPVGFALCEGSGVHPLAMTYAVAIAAGLAFTLPISSPPIAICYASGYYGVKDILKYGMVITALSLVAMVGLIVVHWRLAGVPLTQ
jgi:sodium-dependent dicarboxylate transporter 2/3/5